MVLVPQRTGQCLYCRSRFHLHFAASPQAGITTHSCTSEHFPELSSTTFVHRQLLPLTDPRCPLMYRVLVLEDGRSFSQIPSLGFIQIGFPWYGISSVGVFEVVPSFAHLTPAVKTYDEHPWPLHQHKNHSIPPISQSPNTKCSFCIPSKVDVHAHYGSFAICSEFVQTATSTVLTIMPSQRLSFLAIRHVSTHGRWKFSNAGS